MTTRAGHPQQTGHTHQCGDALAPQSTRTLKMLDRSRSSRSSGSLQPLASAFRQGHPGGDEAPLPHHGGHPPWTHEEGLPISTHESPEAAVATLGDVGPIFRHDTNPTATSDRLRQLWQAGAHDITLTFSDDTPVPPPGHSER